jgi:hypothetical protein
MAENHHPPADDASSEGSMDITENIKTWLAFWKVTQWSAVALAVLGLLLLIFRTNDGG